MKKDLIQVGTTYCNKTGNTAREVVKIEEMTERLQEDMRLGRYTVDGERVYAPMCATGDRFVIYRQIRGSGIGSLGSLSLQSFATWAHREDSGASAPRKQRIIEALVYLRARVHKHLADEAELRKVDELIEELKG
jgi:hypothetical protein